MNSSNNNNNNNHHSHRCDTKNIVPSKLYQVPNICDKILGITNGIFTMNLSNIIFTVFLSQSYL